MRKITLSLFLIFTLVGVAHAQRYAKVSVGFYNLENLFDTEDGPNNDAEYLPQGANKWTPERYAQKLDNMASAISQIAAGKAPDILGVCEIENRQVLEDLVVHPKLFRYGYQIAHFDSPDLRGIDCALLYRPSVLKVESQQAHPVRIPGEPHIKTRDVLVVDGLVGDERFSFLVAHWPSRAGGEQISLGRRMAAALLMRSLSDSLTTVDPERKLILMGDLNDDPTSPSLIEGLRTKNSPEGLVAGDLFNSMAKLYLDGYGTLAYRDVWNLFDNIITSANLVGEDLSTFKLQQDNQTKAYGRIFNAAFLTQQSGQFKGYPLRTFSYGQFQNGYSDHYPVLVYLVKEVH